MNGAKRRSPASMAFVAGLRRLGRQQPRFTSPEQHVKAGRLGGDRAAISKNARRKA